MWFSLRAPSCAPSKVRRWSSRTCIPALNVASSQSNGRAGDGQSFDGRSLPCAQGSSPYASRGRRLRRAARHQAILGRYPSGEGSLTAIRQRVAIRRSTPGSRVCLTSWSQRVRDARDAIGEGEGSRWCPSVTLAPCRFSRASTRGSPHCVGGSEKAVGRRPTYHSHFLKRSASPSAHARATA